MQETEPDKIFDYNKSRTHLQRLIADWSEEIVDTDNRRKIRKIDIDVKDLRRSGALDEDETLIPVRVIDTNITREQPPFINYLKNSRRVAIFTPVSNPQTDTGLLEEEFTKLMTYSGWEVPHFKCLDGSQLHGWDAIEVEYDESKPGRVGLSHIGHDMLFFPMSMGDIQQAPRVIRAFDVTIQKLQDWVATYNFSAEQVDLLYRKINDTNKEFETLRIYRQYFKKDGVVYVSWFTLTEGQTDWLKTPEKLFIGIKEKQLTQVPVETVDPITGLPTVILQEQEVWINQDVRDYPIFVLYYRETEEKKVVDHKARGFLDENKQEAQTAILSAFVNGLTRASNVYASPKSEDGTGSSLKELEQKLVPGRILSKPIEYFSPPYPDPLVLRFMQYSDTANAQETNQVNFAAMNREDSRKTATEIGAAKEQQTMINSVQLTLFSTHIRGIYSYSWLIVQSQALQGNIVFCRIAEMDQTGQPTGNWVNNAQLIDQVYDVRAAGDVDVVQRDEKIQKMMQDWPVIQQTALRDTFLIDLIKLKYPDNGERYANVLAQSGQMQQQVQLIQRLTTVLQGALQSKPDLLEGVPAQQLADMHAMMQQASQYLPGGKV